MLLSNWILSEYQFLITLPGNGTSKVTVRLILNRTTRTGSFRLCNHLSSLLADSSFVRAQIARRWQPSVQYSIRGTSDGRVLVGGVDQPRRLTRLINHASFFFLSFLFFYGNQERRLRGSTKSRSRRWPFLARIPSGAVVRSPAVSTRDALVTRKNRRGWRLTGPSTLSTRERRWKIHRGEKSHGAKGRIQRFQRGEIAKGRARWPEEKKSYSIEEPVLGRSTRPPIPLRKVNASKRREDTIDPRDPLSKYRETARKKRPVHTWTTTRWICTGFDGGPRDTDLLPLPLAAFALSSLPLLLRLAARVLLLHAGNPNLFSVPRRPAHVGVYATRLSLWIGEDLSWDPMLPFFLAPFLL